MSGKEKHFGTGIGDHIKVGIGIDQSLTGFALAVVAVESPTDYDVYVYKSPYNGVQRLADISQWMTDKFNSLAGKSITDVAMEGTVLASHSALVLGELAATVKLTLWAKKFLPLQIPPMTLKKYASGKGTSKKQEMLMQIYKRFGVELNDDNAADAYCLARLAGKIHLANFDKEIVDKVHGDLKFRDTIQ